MFSLAFKNLSGLSRAAYRSISGEESSEATTYKEEIVAEIKSICDDVIGLISDSILPKAKENSEQVFWLKMQADYNRYLAEVISNKGFDKQAAELYEKAFTIAKTNLTAVDPIRLGLVLNMTVCLYEILKDKNKAIELAKQAFDDAIGVFNEEDDKDAGAILQLLRNNLTLCGFFFILLNHLPIK